MIKMLLFAAVETQNVDYKLVCSFKTSNHTQKCQPENNFIKNYIYVCLQIIHSRPISQSLLVSDISNKRGKIGRIGCPGTSVNNNNNNKHKLRNNTGE